jgi:tRNA G46 methylase TrmB
MIRPEVLDHLARVMKSRSLLRVATDHAAYAEVMRELLPVHPSFEDLSGEVGLWELPGMNEFIRGGVTNFEIKYRVEGRPIHKFVLRRKAR